MACGHLKQDHQHPSVNRDEIQQQYPGSLGQSKLKHKKERDGGAKLKMSSEKE